jgi:hypothetical protein
MLIKLPNKIANIDQLERLIKDLKSGNYKSSSCVAFFEANPRVSQEPQATKMIVKYLETILAKPTQLFVTFAQAPDEDFKTELIDWLRENISDNILLSIDINPMLTGGMVIRSPRRIYDYSWSKILGDKKDKLIELMSHG